MERSPADITDLLNRAAIGDEDAAAQLVPLIYEELRKLARRCLQRERVDHTLQPTALIHEAYLRLAKPRASNWESRSQFFAVAATTMRNILVDYARAQVRTKRGGKQHKLNLDDVLLSSSTHSEEVIAVHELLGRLEAIDSRQAKVVELRYFAGLSFDEVSEVLGVSTRTVKRDWDTARAWLYGELKERYANEFGTLE